MKVTLYIPFANGDAVNGFKYEGEELTAKKYIKMEEDEYYGHRRSVDHMVITSLGNNMSYNNYEKRKINVKNQTYAFHRCNGNIRNIDSSDADTSQLERLWANKEQFALYIYLDAQEFSKKPDLETDLKMWIQDSQKIMKIGSLSDQEKMFHLPKKDFKIDFDEGKTHAVLKNCKFAKLLSSIKKANGEPTITSFAMIIERIIFTKK